VKQRPSPCGSPLDTTFSTAQLGPQHGPNGPRGLDLVAGITPEGSPVEPFIGKVPQQGNTVPIPKGGTEWAYNIGTETYREILIELLDT
jgi:hypothetical protein